MGESLGDLGTSLTIYTPPVNLMQSLELQGQSVLLNQETEQPTRAVWIG